MLKFGFRNNFFYPLMFFVFSFLRICLDKILKIHPYKNNIDFIITFLIFSSQSLIGFIIYLYYRRKNSVKEIINNSPIRIGTIQLIITKPKQNKDSLKKIILLLFFASAFNFIGSIIRSDDVINFGKKEENNSQLEIRVRSIQIIFSSLLCYYTIRLNIYKHQKLSLIVISIFLAILLILEILIANEILNKILALLICFISCLFRSYMDVTEKYLLDINYIDILKILIYEGLIGVFFFIFYFWSNETYQYQGKDLLNDMSHFDFYFISFIVLILLYIIISGLRNAYRLTTNKYYSPMSRALFESTLDPLLFLYNTLTSDGKDEYGKGFWIYFSIVVFCLFIISFFSLVYNDFIILYCCGLEYNTHKEINKRLYLKSNLNNIALDDLISSSSINDGSNNSSNSSFYD